MKRIFIIFAALALFMEGCGTQAQAAGSSQAAAAQTAAQTTEAQTAAPTAPAAAPTAQTTAPAAQDAATAARTAAPSSSAQETKTGPASAGSPLMDMTVRDLDGNEVELGSLISQNKVTMLNFWGTFCGPCIREMPGLGELEREYKDRGFEILGLTSDIVTQDGSLDQEAIRDARYIAEQTGVTYPLLVAGMDLIRYAELYAVPTTFFVDAEGTLLAEPVIGSQEKAVWEQTGKELLEKAK